MAASSAPTPDPKERSRQEREAAKRHMRELVTGIFKEKEIILKESKKGLSPVQGPSSITEDELNFKRIFLTRFTQRDFGIPKYAKLNNYDDEQWINFRKHQAIVEQLDPDFLFELLEHFEEFFYEESGLFEKDFYAFIIRQFDNGITHSTRLKAIRAELTSQKEQIQKMALQRRDDFEAEQNTKEKTVSTGFSDKKDKPQTLVGSVRAEQLIVLAEMKKKREQFVDRVILKDDDKSINPAPPIESKSIKKDPPEVKEKDKKEKNKPKEELSPDHVREEERLALLKIELAQDELQLTTVILADVLQSRALYAVKLKEKLDSMPPRLKRDELLKEQNVATDKKQTIESKSGGLRSETEKLDLIKINEQLPKVVEALESLEKDRTELLELLPKAIKAVGELEKPGLTIGPKAPAPESKDTLQTLKNSVPELRDKIAEALNTTTIASKDETDYEKLWAHLKSLKLVQFKIRELEKALVEEAATQKRDQETKFAQDLASNRTKLTAAKERIDKALQDITWLQENALSSADINTDEESKIAQGMRAAYNQYNAGQQNCVDQYSGTGLPKTINPLTVNEYIQRIDQNITEALASARKYYKQKPQPKKMELKVEKVEKKPKKVKLSEEKGPSSPPPPPKGQEKKQDDFVTLITAQLVESFFTEVKIDNSKTFLFVLTGFADGLSLSDESFELKEHPWYATLVQNTPNGDVLNKLYQLETSSDHKDPSNQFIRITDKNKQEVLFDHDYLAAVTGTSPLSQILPEKLSTDVSAFLKKALALPFLKKALKDYPIFKNDKYSWEKHKESTDAFNRLNQFNLAFLRKLLEFYIRNVRDGQFFSNPRASSFVDFQSEFKEFLITQYSFGINEQILDELQRKIDKRPQDKERIIARQDLNHDLRAKEIYRLSALAVLDKKISIPDDGEDRKHINPKKGPIHEPLLLSVAQQALQQALLKERAVFFDANLIKATYDFYESQFASLTATERKTLTDKETEQLKKIFELARKNGTSGYMHPVPVAGAGPATQPQYQFDFDTIRSIFQKLESLNFERFKNEQRISFLQRKTIREEALHRKQKEEELKLAASTKLKPVQIEAIETEEIEDIEDIEDIEEKETMSATSGLSPTAQQILKQIENETKMLEFLIKEMQALLEVLEVFGEQPGLTGFLEKLEYIKQLKDDALIQSDEEKLSGSLALIKNQIPPLDVFDTAIKNASERVREKVTVLLKEQHNNDSKIFDAAIVSSDVAISEMNADVSLLNSARPQFKYGPAAHAYFFAQSAKKAAEKIAKGYRSALQADSQNKIARDRADLADSQSKIIAENQLLKEAKELFAEAKVETIYEFIQLGMRGDHAVARENYSPAILSAFDTAESEIIKSRLLQQAIETSAEYVKHPTITESAEENLIKLRDQLDELKTSIKKIIVSAKEFLKEVIRKRALAFDSTQHLQVMKAVMGIHFELNYRVFSEEIQLEELQSLLFWMNKALTLAGQAHAPVAKGQEIIERINKIKNDVKGRLIQAGHLQEVEVKQDLVDLKEESLEKGLHNLLEIKINTGSLYQLIQKGLNEILDEDKKESKKNADAKDSEREKNITNLISNITDHISKYKLFFNEFNFPAHTIALLLLLNVIICEHQKQGFVRPVPEGPAPDSFGKVFNFVFDRQLCCTTQFFGNNREDFLTHFIGLLKVTAPGFKQDCFPTITSQYIVKLAAGVSPLSYPSWIKYLTGYEGFYNSDDRSTVESWRIIFAQASQEKGLQGVRDLYQGLLCKGWQQIDPLVRHVSRDLAYFPGIDPIYVLYVLLEPNDLRNSTINYDDLALFIAVINQKKDSLQPDKKRAVDSLVTQLINRLRNQPNYDSDAIAKKAVVNLYRACPIANLPILETEKRQAESLFSAEIKSINTYEALHQFYLNNIKGPLVSNCRSSVRKWFNETISQCFFHSEYYPESKKAFIDLCRARYVEIYRNNCRDNLPVRHEALYNCLFNNMKHNQYMGRRAVDHRAELLKLEAGGLRGPASALNRLL